MLPKLENAFKAINSGVSEVCIGKSDELALLKEQLFGTRLFA
jgi:acetylglutamate kinase